MKRLTTMKSVVESLTGNRYIKARLAAEEQAKGQVERLTSMIEKRKKKIQKWEETKKDL